MLLSQPAYNDHLSGAGGSPTAAAVTSAPPSIEAINAFAIPALDISADDTGATAHFANRTDF